MIIGVTDEAPEVMDPWIRRTRPGYPVVIMKGNDFEKAMRVDSLPSHAVIDTEGKIAYSDGFGRTGSEKALAAAMGKAKKGSCWPKKFDKAALLMAAGRFDASYAELSKALAGAAGFTPDEQAAADKLRSFLEVAAFEALSAGRAAFDAGRIYDAQELILLYAEAKHPFPSTPECAALLAEMRALPTFKLEMKAGARFVLAKSFERESRYTEAFNAYKVVTRDHGQSKLAAVARTEAEAIIVRGLPGYEPTCETCLVSGRACDNHKEKVRL